jgi:hypothetical protein
MVYFVALPFVRVDGGLAPGEAVECPHEGAAIRRAQAMACTEAIAGAVAAAGKSRPRRVRRSDDSEDVWGGAERFAWGDMTRRKGELTGGRIDRGWPHQVALH